jgi:dipeptidyl-peptidase-4
MIYIARMQWTNDANVLSAQVLNRHQDNLDLVLLTGLLQHQKIVLNEKDKSCLLMLQIIYIHTNRSFIWTSEKDGSIISMV